MAIRNPPAGDITLADVQAMFAGRIANPSLVQTGLPSLNQAMRDANINTSYRKAAFLATLVHESRLEYNIREIGDTRLYGGRGYIQLTSDFNYGRPVSTSASTWSASPSWPGRCSGAPRSPAGTGPSPAISTRSPTGSRWAGSTPRSATRPAPRTTAAARPSRAAIAYLSGQPAPVVDCSRTATLSGDTTGLTRAQFDALAKEGTGGLG